MRVIKVFIILTFFSSCTFNRIILEPQKISTKAKKATIIVGRDTTILTLSGGNFQPIFSDTKGNIRQYNYSIESILIKRNKKDTLNAWFIKPALGKPIATLFFLHGSGGNIISHYPTTLNLVKNGFQVFILDYSGYGFSNGKATRNNALNDSYFAFLNFLERDDVKGTKIIVYGQSFGGYVAPLLAKKIESSIDGLVLEGACSSIKDVAAYESKLGFIARILISEKESPAHAITKFKKPLLVIHSEEDTEMPIKFGKKIFDKAGNPKEFYQIQKCHMCGPVFYSDSISTKIKRMIGI